MYLIFIVIYGLFYYFNENQIHVYLIFNVFYGLFYRSFFLNQLHFKIGVSRQVQQHTITHICSVHLTWLDVITEIHYMFAHIYFSHAHVFQYLLLQLLPTLVVHTLLYCTIYYMKIGKCLLKITYIPLSFILAIL